MQYYTINAIDEIQPPVVTTNKEQE